MAKLTTAMRDKLPKSSFGEPGKRAYPMPDAAHARNAKARASQAVHAGRMSKAEEEKIDAKADRKIGKKSSERKPDRKSAGAPAPHRGNGRMPETPEHGMSRRQLEDHGLHTSRYFGGESEH